MFPEVNGSLIITQDFSDQLEAHGLMIVNKIALEDMVIDMLEEIDATKQRILARLAEMGIDMSVTSEYGE